MTHILGGGSGNVYKPCPYTSSEAKAVATEERANSKAKKRGRSDTNIVAAAATVTTKKLKQATLLPHVFKGNDIPFTDAETKAIRAQVLRVMVSANTAARAFEDPEMLRLMGMLRTAAPAIMPTGKVLLGSLLTDAAKPIKAGLAAALNGKEIGLK